MFFRHDLVEFRMQSGACPLGQERAREISDEGETNLVRRILDLPVGVSRILEIVNRAKSQCLPASCSFKQSCRELHSELYTIMPEEHSEPRRYRCTGQSSTLVLSC